MAYIGQKPADKALVASDLDPAVITGQTALATSPADTDEFLISDAGVLKRLDASLIGGGVSNSFLAHGMSGNASGVLVFNSELHDDGGNYAVGNGRYTAPSDGHYLFFSQALKTGAAGTDYYFKKNGTAVIGATGWGYNGDSNQNQLIITAILDLDANDYIQIHSSTEVYGNQYIVFGGCKLY